MKLRSVLLLVLLAPILVVLHTVSAAAATTLQFPDVTVVNTDLHPYVIQVENPPAEGHFETYVNSARTVVPLGDTIEVPFGKSGRYTVIVWYCSVEEVCGEVGRSSFFQVFVDLPFTSGGGRVGAGPKTTRVKLGIPDVTIDVDWELRPQGGGEAVSSGSQVLQFGADGYSSIGFTVPAGLADEAVYGLVLHGALDHPELGHLESHSPSGFFRVDSAPPQVYLRTSDALLFPARDGYRDTVRITGGANRGHDPSLSIVRDGRTVRTFAGRSVTWDGRVDGKVVGPGQYAVRFSASDEFGNRGTVERNLTVKDGELETRTVTRTYSAVGSELDRLVQACSRLVSPSSHDWRGSLGYYSQTSCKRPRASAVVTVHGVYLPKAFDDRYVSLRVSVFGGSAQGSSGDYIVLGYLRPDGDGSTFEKRAQFDGRLGWHDGRLGTSQLVREDRNGSYLVWQLGLSEGSRYDVKGFRVEIAYRVLS